MMLWDNWRGNGLACISKGPVQPTSAIPISKWCAPSYRPTIASQMNRCLAAVALKPLHWLVEAYHSFKLHRLTLRHHRKTMTTCNASTQHDTTHRSSVDDLATPHPSNRHNWCGRQGTSSTASTFTPHAQMFFSLDANHNLALFCSS